MAQSAAATSEAARLQLATLTRWCAFISPSPSNTPAPLLPSHYYRQQRLPVRPETRMTRYLPAGHTSHRLWVRGGTQFRAACLAAALDICRRWMLAPMLSSCDPGATTRRVLIALASGSPSCTSTRACLKRIKLEHQGQAGHPVGGYVYFSETGPPGGGGGGGSSSHAIISTKAPCHLSTHSAGLICPCSHSSPQGIRHMPAAAACQLVAAVSAAKHMLALMLAVCPGWCCTTTLAAVQRFQLYEIAAA